MDVRDQWRGLLADRAWSESDMHGEWPAETAGRHKFVGPHWGHTPDHPTADILLPACSEPWMVPAYLRADCHNDLPDAAVQCALFRSWYRRFGAEVIYTNGCVYEFAVGQPPANRETAMELAREHFLFCPDVCPDDRIYPGPGCTLEALACWLMHSSVWYFWWD